MRVAPSAVQFLRSVLILRFPVYFRATNFRCHPSMVSERTKVAYCCNSAQPIALPRLARLRRWRSFKRIFLPIDSNCCFRTRFSSNRYCCACRYRSVAITFCCFRFTCPGVALVKTDPTSQSGQYRGAADTRRQYCHLRLQGAFFVFA